jgi:hypothetical protein
MKKVYIPWFIEPFLMECRIEYEKMKNSIALQLTDVVELFLQGHQDNHFVYQTINCENGFINNEYPREIVNQFDAWILLDKDANIYQYVDDIEKLKLPHKDNYTLGYPGTLETQGEQVSHYILPITKDIYEDLLIGKTINYHLAKVENLSILYQLETPPETQEK